MKSIRRALEGMNNSDIKHKEPEWTAENINRKEGDSTFIQCGWCEHASCGSHRYNCYLETHCSLMASYGLGHEVYWDTPCLVKMMSKKDMEYVIDSKKYEIQEYKNSIKSKQEEIALIKKLKLSEKKPILVEYRKHNHFNVKDIVWVFHEKKWNRGICVLGYRHHDGCVSYVLDDYPESKKSWGCGTGTPCVVLDNEYKYFKKNLDDYLVWLGLSDRKYNGKYLQMTKMFIAMREAK